MNKNFSTLLLSALMASTNLCAIQSITKMLDDPKVIAAMPEGADIESVKINYAIMIEDPYNRCNALLGDEITEKLSEEMIEPIKRYDISLIEGTTDSKSVDKLVIICKKFIEHLKTKKESTDSLVLAFLNNTINMCLIIVDLNLTVNYPDLLDKIRSLSPEEQTKLILKKQNGILVQHITELQNEYFPELFEKQKGSLEEQRCCSECDDCSYDCSK